MRPADIESLRRGGADACAANDDPLPQDGGDADAATPLYSTSWRDLLVVAVTHGQVALVIPFAVNGYGDLAQWLPLPSDAQALAWALSGGPWLLVGSSLAAGLAYGVVRAWLRFGGHRVRLVDNRYEVTRSAVGRGTRAARVDDVVGVRIDQNPLMRMLRVGTLHLVLRRGQGATQALTVLPIASLGLIRRHVATLLPGELPSTTPAHPGPVMAVAALTVASVGGLLVGGQPWLAGLAALVGLWLADRVATSLNIGPACLVVHQRGWVSRRTYMLAAEAVRTTSAWRVGDTAWSGLALTVLDRAPIVLRTWGMPSAREECVSKCVR